MRTLDSAGTPKSSAAEVVLGRGVQSIPNPFGRSRASIAARRRAPRDATEPQYPVAKVPRCLVSAAPINTPFSRKMLCAEPQAS
jgi:hypothetical protein